MNGMPQVLKTLKINPRRVVFFVTVSVFVVGLVSTSIIITVDLSLSQRQALTYAMKELDSRSLSHANDTTVISSPTYAWILRYVYHYNNTLGDFRDVIFTPVTTQDWLLIADEHFRAEMMLEPKLAELYDQREAVMLFNSYPLAGMERVSYPYTNFLMNVEGCDVEIAVRQAAEMNVTNGIGSITDSSRCIVPLKMLLEEYSLNE
jgi:hypothetical protein